MTSYACGVCANITTVAVYQAWKCTYCVCPPYAMTKCSAYMCINGVTIGGHVKTEPGGQRNRIPARPWWSGATTLHCSWEPQASPQLQRSWSCHHVQRQQASQGPYWASCPAVTAQPPLPEPPPAACSEIVLGTVYGCQHRQVLSLCVCPHTSARSGFACTSSYGDAQH